jgi:hypothetical protein
MSPVDRVITVKVAPGVRSCSPSPPADGRGEGTPMTPLLV